jgi:hypothetical protein
VARIAQRVSEAVYSPLPPPFLRKTKPRGRKRQGVKYELFAQAMMAERFGGAYRPSPWIRFTDETGRHWCQPDGLLETPHGLVIVEFKYQHTVDAWQQLRLLYEPVVEVLHPGRPVAVLEVVKWYDCAVEFPEPVRLVADITEHKGTQFGVHIWKP